MISKQKLIDIITVFTNAHNNSETCAESILQQLNDIENQYAPTVDSPSLFSSNSSSSPSSDNSFDEDNFGFITSSQDNFSLVFLDNLNSNTSNNFALANFDANELANQNMLLNDTDAEDFSNQLLAALQQSPVNGNTSSLLESPSDSNDSLSDSESSASSDNSSSDSDSNTISENSNDNEAEQVAMITSAHVAAAFGRLDILKELVKDTHVDISLPYSADNIKVNGKDGLGVSLLHIATIFGHTELVEFLLLNGANIFATQEFGWLSVIENQLNFRDKLEHATQSQNLPQFIKGTLLERGDTPNNNDNDVRTFNYAKYRTAEFEATIHGYYKILEMLLFVKQRIPYIEQSLDMLPIHAAAMRGNLRSFNMLIAAGANKNANDIHSLTPFILAAESTTKASIALFRALLDDEQIDPNEWGDDGINVFRMLLEHHNLEKLKYLLAHPRFDITKQEDCHIEQILIELYYYVTSDTDRYELMSSAWAKVFANNSTIPIYLPVTEDEYQQHNLQNALPLLHSLASMGYAEVLADLITYIKHQTNINLQEALHTKINQKTPLDYVMSSDYPQDNDNQDRAATARILLQHGANPDDLVQNNLPTYMQELANYFSARPAIIQNTISDAEQPILGTALNQSGSLLTDFLAQHDIQTDHIETNYNVSQINRAEISSTRSNTSLIPPNLFKRRHSTGNITDASSTTMPESDLSIQQPNKRTRWESRLFDATETTTPASPNSTPSVSPAVVTAYAGSLPTNS